MLEDFACPESIHSSNTLLDIGKTAYLTAGSRISGIAVVSRHPAMECLIPCTKKIVPVSFPPPRGGGGYSPALPMMYMTPLTLQSHHGLSPRSELILVLERLLIDQ